MSDGESRQTGDSLRWTLPQRLTRFGVESWLGGVGPEVTEVTFHLSHRGCSSSPGGAESLQSAICLLQRRGVRTLLSLPPTSFESGRGESLFIDDVEGHGTEAEKTLAYRLPGLVLAQLCEPAPGVEQLREVARRQAQQLKTNLTVFGHGKYRSLAVIGATDHRTHLRASEREREDLLEERIRRLLSGTADSKTARGGRRFEPSSDHPLLHELVEFVYQATENTFDHARRSFDGELIPQVRTVAIERQHVGTGAGAVPIERVAGDSAGSLARYLDSLKRRAERRDEDPERLSLLSVTVADGGVGIAARMNDGFDVFDRDLSHEYALVQRAVLPDGTTKPSGQPGRGAGLVKMMRATHRLGGRLELRTGRLALSRTYLDDDGASDANVDFTGNAGPAYDLDGAGDQFELVAGTAVSVLFPAFDMGRNASPGDSERHHRGRAQRSGVLV